MPVVLGSGLSCRICKSRQNHHRIESRHILQNFQRSGVSISLHDLYNMSVIARFQAITAQECSRPVGYRQVSLLSILWRIQKKFAEVLQLPKNEAASKGLVYIREWQRLPCGNNSKVGVLPMVQSNQFETYISNDGFSCRIVGKAIFVLQGNLDISATKVSPTAIQGRIESDTDSN